jgi:hypothetical protein
MAADEERCARLVDYPPLIGISPEETIAGEENEAMISQRLAVMI